VHYGSSGNPQEEFATGCVAVAAVAGVLLVQPAWTQHAHMEGMLTSGKIPTLPGQDAFGAVQEIVEILEADPAIDWSKVNLDRLRQHLIDMHEVTLRANATVQPIQGGIQMTVTGSGRTLEAIQRMIPAQASEINGKNRWQAWTQTTPDGVTFVVTSADPKQVEIIRGLGFIGIMASGTHHQMHHLMMAKGEFTH
jgi:hypothetical protein